MNKLSNIKNKINIIIILSFLLLFILVFPTFCRLLTETEELITYWDGTSAKSYKSGTGSEIDPYIISTPHEFAYFKDQVNLGEDYEGKYFEITNDLYFNQGVIEYQKDLILYIKDSKKYYIKPYTNEYYIDSLYEKKIGTINKFDTINDFKGTINGNSKNIYGIYLTDNNTENNTLTLFNNLSGNLKNINIANFLIYGQVNAGFINNSINSTINNVLFNGTIKNEAKPITNDIFIEDINLIDLATAKNINNPELPEGAVINKITLTGTLTGDNVTINENLITDPEFTIEFSNPIDLLIITGESPDTSLTNLKYTIEYSYDVTSFILNNNNTTITNSIIKGKIIGKSIASSFVGISKGPLNINNSYNTAEINSEYISGALVGIIDNSNVEINNIYNQGTVKSKQYASGLIGYVNNTNENTLNINNSFNIGEITAPEKGALISYYKESNFTYNNNYHIDESLPSIGNSEIESSTYIELSSLLKESFLNETLLYSEEIWDLSDSEIPVLSSFDNIDPIITLSILENKWSDINSLTTLNYNITLPLQVVYTDTISDILKVEYYIDSSINPSLLDVYTIDYEIYSDNINLENSGYYTIYFKVTDTQGNVSYANTDTIFINGYALTITDNYNNLLNKFNNQITSTSSIKYNFTKTLPMNEYSYTEEAYYTLESNYLFDNNTIVKLIDNIYDKVYVLVIDENTEITTIDNKYRYDLTLFKELGTTETNYFTNKGINYYKDSILEENFDIIIDFKNTNIENNGVINLELLLLDENQIYSSVLSNINNEFTLVKNDNNEEFPSYNLDLDLDYSGYLNLSEENEKNITITNQIIYKQLNNNNIYDSSVDSDNISMYINLMDSEDNIITDNSISSISFLIDETKYYANEEGLVKIPVNSGITDLKISVDYIANTLVNGTYYLNIYSCLENNICSKNSVIPVSVNNKVSKANYKLHLSVDEQDRLILRDKGLTLNNDKVINFNIDYEGEFTNPNIRVLLYKKLNYSAYNQTYELVNLNNYLISPLEEVTENSYEFYILDNVLKSNFINLELDIDKFQYGGYKFVFELYDGTSYIASTSKTILIK